MSKTALSQAIKTLRDGELIAYPTEAVWGVGCDPLNESAVTKLLTLKQRPVEKGLILVAATIEQFSAYLTDVSREQYQQLQVSWPGFQTWVVPAPDWVPKWLTGDFTGIALRVSTHPVVRGLCLKFDGPLVSTSANPAGQPPAMTVRQVRHYFAEQALIVPGELGGADAPSSIIDLVSGQPLR